MISDTLFDAIAEIERYLSDDAFADAYEGFARERIVALRDQMEDVARELTTPPSDGDD